MKTIGKEMKERGKELAPIREMAFQIWKENPEIRVKTLHSQLKEHGYEVNYYTLRTWMKRWRKGKPPEKKGRFDAAGMRERGKEMAPIRQTAFEIWERNPEIKPAELHSQLKQYGKEVNLSTCMAWLYKWRNGRGLARKRKVEAEPVKAESVKVEPTWEQIKSVVLQAFEEAGKVPMLEEDNNRLRNIVAAQKEQIKSMATAQQTEINKDQRYRVALQQGEINKPVATRGS